MEKLITQLAIMAGPRRRRRKKASKSNNSSSVVNYNRKETSIDCLLIVVICIFITLLSILSRETSATSNQTTTEQAGMYATNMSQIMSAPFMTPLNASLHQMNSNKSASSSQSASNNPNANQMLASSMKTSGVQVASYNNKNQPVKGSNNRQQQQQTTNSPGFNSRLKSAPIQLTSSNGKKSATDNQRYLQLAELEQQQQALQLEKPNGYSYDQSGPSQATASYTHTSQLNPVKQEVLLAEKLKQKQRNYYQAPETAADRSTAHSVFGLNVQEQQEQQQQLQRSLGQFSQQQQQQIEQLSVSGKSAPTFQPQFGHASSHHEPSSSILKPPVAHLAGGAFTMPPPGPHISITGTALNPCKPPQLSAAHNSQQDLTQSTIQIMNSNDIASNSAQALPNFSTPKYVRVGDGTRLRSGLIFKVIRADSLTDCELACTRASSLANNNQQDTCRSFNYRAYFAAENCELSRHDWRQLKLDDSAQFEQHTQFDFYALDMQQQQASSAAMMMSASSSSNINSIQQQQISTNFSPFPEADCLDVSQTCTQDGMEFTLRTNEPFNGRIYTYGFYDSCFTDGDGSTSSLLRISRSNGFPRCGTQQIGDLMTNIVVVQFNDFVQTTRDKKYNLTCYFSGPGEAVVTSNYLDTKIDERSHPIQIEHLPPQNVITSNVHLRVLYRGQPTNTIAVGDLLTFRLETRHNHNHSRGRASSTLLDGNSNNSQQQQQQQQSEIFATNVIAKDPYSGKQVQLIDSRGCPIDPVNVFPELQRTPDGALESEFYAFKIPDSNFLIFQATVRTCKAPCEPVICQTPTNHQQYSIINQAAIINNAYGGTKGGYSMQPQHHSAALLQAANNNHVSVPSWGKKKKKRRRRNTYFDDESSSSSNEDLNLGESIEHIIPIRIQSNELSMDNNNNARTPKQMQMVTTVKRPELAEAEEEVKEMFKVYLSRAEINSNNRINKQQQQEQMQKSQADENYVFNENQPLINSNSNSGQQLSSSSEVELINTAVAATTICITQSGYYILLFTVISLTMVLLSILFVSFYVTKKGKFKISDSIATSSIHF